MSTDDDFSNDKTTLRERARTEGPTPQRLGRYTLRQRLGVGGMAEVYLAEQDGPQQFKKRVVVKRILPSLAADAGFVAMFVREAQLAARLSHVNVVQIYELGEERSDDGGVEYFIAMEHIDGLTLQRLATACWSEGRAMPVEVVLRACADAARGLHAAHTLIDEDGRLLSLVHRDISPDNLMLSRDGITKVLDFGIAKGESLGGPKTRTGQLRGKVPYMAPEQIQGHAVDGRADLWALGVSLYWLLCGERPFDRGTDYHTMAAILGDEPRSPRSFNPGVPEPLEAIILSLLDKDPAHRPQTGAAVADLLEEMTPPGSGAGRRPTVAFVEHFLAVGQKGTGNPLSESGDQTSNTRPLPGKASTGAPVASHDQPPGEPPAPRQVTWPERGASAEPSWPSGSVFASLPPGAAALVPDAASAAPGAPPANESVLAPPSTASSGLSSSGAVFRDAPVPPSLPTVTATRPLADRPPLEAMGDAAKATPPTAAPAGNHPVIDLLAPAPSRSSWPAAVVVAGAMVALAGLGVGAWQASEWLGGTDGPDTAADAGPLIAANLPPTPAPGPAPVPAPPSPAPPTPRVVDAGVGPGAEGPAVPPPGSTVPPTLPTVPVDAGPATSEALTVDAGVPPPSNRLTVVARAPRRVEWRLEGGAVVGRGNATLSLPKGTSTVVAVDEGRRISVPMPVTRGKPLDYTSLATAKLVPRQKEGRKVFIGRELIEGDAAVALVPGSYDLRVTEGAKILSKKKLDVKPGQELVVDAASP